MKFWTELLLFLGLLLFTQPSVAYDTDGHFYTVYVIAMDSGFTREESLEVATMVEYTDWDTRTDALQWPYPAGPGNEQRRLYHFPCNSAHSADWTQQNSAWAKHNVNMALKANNRTKLGIAIHVYQDSYSHEAYGQVKGHLLAFPSVHHPDYPYRWTDKYVNMTNLVYTIMKQYRVNNGLSLVDRKLLPDFYLNAASFTPDWWWVHTGVWPQSNTKDYTENNLQPRIDWWKSKIVKTFPGVEMPVYQTPAQSVLDEFTRVVTAYKLPNNEGDLDNSQWSEKDAITYAPVTAPLIAATLPTADEAELARILEMPIKWGARRLATTATQVGSDARIQARLTNETALGAMLDSADLTENPAFIAYIVNYWSWINVDVASQLELRLGSASFRIRMLCAGLLSSSATLSDLTSQKLRATYQAVADSNLSAADRAYIVDMVPTDPERIALHAPAAVGILRGLMQYPDTATGAAAKLYLVNVDTSRLPQAGPFDSIRADAFNALQSQGAQNAANGARYWIIRSYEDFDGAVSNSPKDADRIAVLLKIWTWADAARDVEALRAAAVALSTYDKNDAVPRSLVDALKSSLAKAEFADLALDIRNALQAVTGQEFL
jgi:hypothetical protein